MNDILNKVEVSHDNLNCYKKGVYYKVHDSGSTFICTYANGSLQMVSLEDGEVLFPDCSNLNFRPIKGSITIRTGFKNEPDRD